MNMHQVEELILQALEHELDGIKVYKAALRCAQDDDLKDEWERALNQTRTHVAALKTVCEAMGIDALADTPLRAIARNAGAELVRTMEAARVAGNPLAAQLVACECVVASETKDQRDWDLLTACAEHLYGPGTEALRSACDVIAAQEDEHLQRSHTWYRNLWLASLGLKPRPLASTDSAPRDEAPGLAERGTYDS